MKRIRKKELEALQSSGLFDEKWYLEQYPDVKMLGMNALEHYLWIGQKLGRSPAASRPNNDRKEVSRKNLTICDVTGTGLPDLFSLRARENNAKMVVVSFASDHAQLNNVRSVLDSLESYFDLILAVPKALSDIAQAAIGNCDHALVIYSEKFGPGHALLHIANSGALSNYEHVLWIDASVRCDASVISVASQAGKQYGTKAGLIASRYEYAPVEHSSFIGGAIGTFLARIGRKKPRATPHCPVGGLVLIPALLLHQLRAYRIQPSELGTHAASGWMISSLLSIICDEAGLRKETWTGTSNAGSSTSDRSLKAIAFYLPQFHPIPENDQWWGKGFTEWTNVVNARPLFRSHYQPNLPADLGFYDLRTPETQHAQAELAKQYNIHGFCYYYYWFDGKKLLNHPIEQMLQAGKPDFPFCVCWANENWSRNWDGQNKHVLLEQSYSLESNRALIHEFITMMKDPRYIRHNGKPVLLVYRIRVIPNWLETAKMWREECRRAGLGEIHLCAVRFGLEPLDGPPNQFGVDSYVLFPPHESEKVDVKAEVLDLAPDFNGTIFSYDAVIEGDIKRFEGGYPWPVHRGAMLGWDNTARRPRDSRIFVGATPARFHNWLKEIVRQEELHNRDEESLIFVNAWNEWAEGTTLEPSTRFGRGYLEAVRSALERGEKSSAGASIGGSKLDRRGSQIKWYDGRIGHLRDAPTILICAHVISDRMFGGERSFLDVLEGLSQLELNVIVALPSDNHRHYRDLTLELSSGVVVIPYHQWRENRAPDEMIVQAFRQVIQERSVDIVYANTIVLLEPLIAAKKEACKTVVHARELIDRDQALIEQIGISAEEIINVVSKNSDFIIANSKATADLFHREGSTFCVPNVVNPDHLDIKSELQGPIRFGIISSNIPKKGVADFIEIARRCEQSYPDASFIVIGPENGYIEELKKDDLPSNVTFAGYAQEPRAAMAMVDVVLSLSHFAESFGRTVAEAQAARRPVIAYDHGAVGELVDHGVTGFLVSHRDVDAAAAAAMQLCANPELIRTMGEAGRSRIVRYNAPKTLKENLWRSFQAICGSSIALRASVVGRTTIVVPVFNAYDETSACLASLEKQIDFKQARVLIIDDASTDPRIRQLVESYASRAGFHLLTNKVNIGYTGTINIGIRWAGGDDVLLLNSDTIVTSGFLEGLRRTAFSEANVGTVTAMSDNAGAFSFPLWNQPNPKPAEISHDAHAATILRRTAACVPVEVPTGSGFCMYIRRALLDVIGLFDEEMFPRGYGEENDFCMRALKSGWRNLISPHAYVFHVRTASFGAEKEILVKEAVDKVTKRHPDYATRVKSAFSSAEMEALRTAAVG
jgi:glycosyltransferase involved in cell wall biosynthesis/GT2 family glycosyltransferase